MERNLQQLALLADGEEPPETVSPFLVETHALVPSIV
jgi:hypothetical protein